MNEDYEKSDSEWKNKLPPDVYHVTRGGGTEPPFSSHLHESKDKGVYSCSNCGQVIFSSDHKFDSGTGWPSFYKPATKNSVSEKNDFKLLTPRREIICSRCGAHLGHVFTDGPQKTPDGKECTGLRYCINGLSLSFQKDE